MSAFDPKRTLTASHKPLPAYWFDPLWHSGAYGKLTMENLLKETEDAALALAWQLQLVAANGPDDLDGAFSAITGAGADALVVLNSPMLYNEHKHIVKLAAKSHLPAMYAAREFADAGGLMAYGANLPEVFRRAATYVAIQRGQASRPTSGATDKVRTRHQSEDGERTGVDHRSRIPALGG